ncbi:hypothetical protein KSK55_03965 [Methanospirillum purgamenti]|uniref:ApeA N-terminal domain-containing protein n=1 Tax=Methanospirillum hungatei TaxID=2203 RepID=A0A8F5VQ74_METHU|nr:HEPN domain-containing protein [Methanospirillum hungatei]QXO95565.1 hypothetical protein KSK55_03965 [Methanospirillum hungatei]
MEEIDCEGYWWLPSNPERKISGRLSYSSRDGGNLTLNGSFYEIDVSLRVSRENIIFGNTKNGKLYTLENCLHITNSFSFPGYYSSDFAVSRIFEGIHSEAPENIEYNLIKIEFTRTNEWFARHPMTYQLNYDREGRIEGTQTALVNFPQSITITIGDCNIEIKMNINFNHNNISGLSINWNWFFKIIPQSPIRFDSVFEQVIFPIQTYISLGLGNPIFPKKIIGFIQSQNPEVVEEQEIKIHFRILGYNENIKAIHPSEMLFTYLDISDVFEDSLNNWNREFNSIQSVIELYHLVMIDDGSLSTYKFNSLIQAIESYHRVRFNGKYVIESEFDLLKIDLIQSIPTSLERDFKESLKGKFTYLNEYSLRKRLKELMVSLNSEYHNILSNYVQNLDQLINKIVDTRNFHAHRDERLRDQILEGSDFIYGIIVLKFILELCLLREIGISSDKLNEMIQRTNKYGNIRTFYSINN